MSIVPLLFQTGYLTVKEIVLHCKQTMCLLHTPNYEVRQAFNLHIMAELSEKGTSHAETPYVRMFRSLESGELEEVLSILKSLFAFIGRDEIEMRVF